MIKHFLVCGTGFVILLAGCAGLAPGQLYTNITQAHSLDFHNTPIGTKRCVLNEHRVKEPVSGYGVTVEWSADLIRSTAKNAGITNITYTEMQTLSILMGTYSRRRLIIYGD